MFFSNTHNYKNLSVYREVFCLISFCFIIQFSTQAQAVIKFKDAKKNFGFVTKGEIVNITYEFSNTGIAPLIITDAKAECSCTSIDFPKQPIAPLASQTMTVHFNTSSVYDRQDRTVEIISNAKNTSQKIRFKGVVLKN